MKARLATVYLLFIALALWFLLSPPTYTYVSTAYVNGGTVLPARVMTSVIIVYPDTHTVKYVVSLADTMYSPRSGTVSWSAVLTSVNYPPLSHSSGRTYTVFQEYSTITVDGKAFTYTTINAKIYTEIPGRKTILGTLIIGAAAIAVILYSSKKNYERNKGTPGPAGPRMEAVLSLPAVLAPFVIVLLHNTKFILLLFLFVVVITFGAAYLLWFIEDAFNEAEDPTYIPFLDVATTIVFMTIAYIGTTNLEVIYASAVAALVVSTFLTYHYPSKEFGFMRYYALTTKDLPDEPAPRMTYVVYQPNEKPLIITYCCSSLSVNGKVYDAVEEVWELLRNAPSMLELL